MMVKRRSRRPAVRNVALGDLHEVLLVSAVGMILIIRLQLWATGYPKLGGGKLHIAHLLYGGALMLVAIGLLLSFIDRRVRVPAAVIGGAGFGFFIDEIGKFVTSDNDYFFRPTAAIIYLTFIAVFFALRFLRHRRGFSSGEYVSNALEVFSGGAADELYESEQREALRLLGQAGNHPLVTELRGLIERTPTVPAPEPSRIQRLTAWASQCYDDASNRIWFQTAIIATFFCFAVVNLTNLVIVVVLIVHYYLPLDLVVTGSIPQIAEQASQLVSLVLVCAGLQYVWRHQRLKGYRMLEAAVLVQLFVGQFFSFIDHSFVAVWAFLACLAMLVTVRFMIRQELRREENPAEPPATTELGTHVAAGSQVTTS
jgi:hypothetical protein